MKKIKNTEEGVTLIALVVTIIVLIILAGVTLSVIMENNRIVDNAQDAVVATEIANFKEKVAMARVTLESEILNKSVVENGYVATSNENFTQLSEEIAHSFGVSTSDIITASKGNNKIASTNGLKVAATTVKTEGYTVSSALDIVGNRNQDGHGYITIWYTSNKLRNGININKALNQYGLADAEDTSNDWSTNQNQAMLVAILHVKNKGAELLNFDSNAENTTSYGLTTTESAIYNAGKKLKETNFAVSTKEYTILTLNANNGTNDKKQEYMKVGNSYIVPENTYNREGYIFKKWNTLANGTGTDYSPGDSISSSNNTELYAKWEAIEYAISYNLDGGIATNPSTYTIESEDFTLNKPTKEGCYFTGWTGSNGSTSQTELVITRGSTGNKTYTANYAQYTPASLRTFNPTDSHVSWSFDTATGIYTITQSAKSSGWGDGVVCDNSTVDIEWGKSYMLEFEIKVPNTCSLKTDGNTMFSSDGSGNDIYGTSWLILDGTRYDGTISSSGDGSLPNEHTITGGTWHKVQMYLMNNNTSKNASHKAIRSYSGFGLDLSSVTTNVTYQMKNLKSIVY